MIRLLHITLVVMVFILALPGAVLAAETGNGTIEGQLVNGTTDGSSVADQEVTLKTYRNNAELASVEAMTDVEGGFVFQGLDTGPEYSYQVTLFYQQAEYSGDRLSFDAGETSKYSEIVVYDATTSDETIRVMTAHTVIYVEQGTLRVSEYLMVVNDSDRTYIGDRELSPGVRETLTFNLPAEATGLEVGASLMSCCIYNNEAGFVDSMSVQPGGKELTYSYQVDYKGTDYVFSRQVNYPMVNYDLLIQSQNVQVIGDQLLPAEPIVIQDRQFNHFTGTDLALGVVSVQISGLPQSASQGSLMWVLLALVLLGTGFTLFYLRRRKRVQPVRVSPVSQSEELFAELARLDDDFEGGKISEEAYRKVRAQKKARLGELMQRSKKGDKYR